MSKKLDFNNKLNFSDADLTPPNIVIEEILNQLPNSTKGIISGAITEYDGPVESYSTQASLVTAVAAITSNEYNIQNSLGEQGYENKKYECYLYTERYTQYKYRMFFIQYGIANYPVKFILEESIARDIKVTSYIIERSTRSEVEELVYKILYSNKVLNVMQELIGVYRIKEALKSAEIENPIDNEE